MNVLISQGKLKKKSIDVLEEYFKIKIDDKKIYNERLSFYKCKDFNLYFVKPKYMDNFLQIYDIDYAIFTNEIIYESSYNFKVLYEEKLDGIKISLIGHSNYKKINTIFTSYKKLSEFKYKDIKIVYFPGSLEIFPNLDKEIGIVDVIETGQSIKVNNLCEIETIQNIFIQVVEPKILKE